MQRQIHYPVLDQRNQCITYKLSTVIRTESDMIFTLLLSVRFASTYFSKTFMLILMTA